MKLLKSFENKSLYYFISLIAALIYWLVLNFINIDFVNIVFFLLAYIWHFSLMVPGSLEYAFKSKSKLSLYVIAIKSNYYLQIFSKKYNFKYQSLIVRAFSPFIFTGMLLILGGSGNLLFTILGSVFFELTYMFLIEKAISYKANL